MVAISKKILTISSVIALVLALAGLIVSIVGLLTGNDTELAIFPEALFIVFGVFNTIVFLVSVLGFAGTVTQSKGAIVVFVVSNIVLAIALIVSLVFLLLYANGISTTDTIDDVLGSSQRNLEQSLVRQALGDPDEWRKYQNTLNCCGVDFETTYKSTFSDLTDGISQEDYIDRLHPGDSCAEGRDEITSLQAAHPEYNDAAEQAWAVNEIIGDGTDYFCKWRVSTLAVENTTYVAIVAGLLILAQLVNITAAIILLVKVSVEEGGFVRPQEDGVDGKPQIHE